MIDPSFDAETVTDSPKSKFQVGDPRMNDLAEALEEYGDRYHGLIVNAARQHLALLPEPCSNCDGLSWGRGSIPCALCHGKGYQYKPETVEAVAAVLKPISVSADFFAVLVLDAINALVILDEKET